MDLFSQNTNTTTFVPLAERMRPQTLNEFIGQKFWDQDSELILNRMGEQNYLPNLILWGPPGTGKTTFATLLSRQSGSRYIVCNAIDTGAKELRSIGNEAQMHRNQFGERTILFIDEIHRLNRSQQDVLLPFTEKGDLSLIGATTENPSYELTQALLSRAQVIIFNPLDFAALKKILKSTIERLNVLEIQILNPEAVDFLVQTADGDARKLLNNFEKIYQTFVRREQGFRFPLNESDLGRFNFNSFIRYDRNRDEHYNLVSAFIKSMRGSDPDAAIYYLARMLEGGEDPVFIARRIVILASEDIGNGDPKALPLAMATLQSVEVLGLPEARIPLAQAAIYMSCAPKSNSAYIAINRAQDFVKRTGALEVPLSLRSAQTKLAKELNYGHDYRYSHDSERGYIPQQFLPNSAKSEKFYVPTNHGFEKNLKHYLEWLKKDSSKS